MWESFQKVHYLNNSIDFTFFSHRELINTNEVMNNEHYIILGV